MKKRKVLVAMSGGVDSSIAAWLLKEEGYEVSGATMRTWACGELDEDEANQKSCCGVEGVSDAREVARKLDIPHYVFNFEKEFKRHVVDYFVDEYLTGRTPNPCIACNRHIKFKLFFERAMQLGYDAIATGHYAQVYFDEATRRYGIRESVDLLKDQSYVLFPLSQEVLRCLHLPIGHFNKSEVRAFAQKLNLKVADKPESQEICFIPSNDYGPFLEKERNMTPEPGDVQDKHGNVLGKHKGYYHYTIGQRKGLQIPFKHALYITEIVADKNVVMVGSKEDVASRQCVVTDVQWFSEVAPGTKVRVEAKIRSQHKKAQAHLECLPDSNVCITFDQPQDAITPGQACVFYDGDRILGGGWIISRSSKAVGSDKSS